MMEWLKETLLASSFLLCLVLLARRPVALWAGPKTVYALWLLPLARMLMPPLPVGGMTFQSLFTAINPQASDMASPPLLLMDVQLPLDSQYWDTLLASTWLGGAVSYLLFQLLRNRRFTQMLVAAKTGSDFQIERVRVWTSAAAQGPLAVGVLRPQVVLPSDFRSRFSDEECELVLVHELMHHRRGDLLSNVAALVLLSLLWFNPLAHAAFRRFREDQELACDADVIAAKGVACRYEYGWVLAKAACQRNAWSLCTLKPADLLKVRLKSLARAQGKGRRRAANVAVFAMFAGVMFLVAPRLLPAPLFEIAQRDERLHVASLPAAERAAFQTSDDDVDSSGRASFPGERSHTGLAATTRTPGRETLADPSARTEPARRAALERLVEIATMKDAPAHEAAVEAKLMQSRARSPT